MGHIRLKEADDILGYRFPVIREGYVRLIGYMGGDKRILDIAGESYGNALPKSDNKAMDFIVKNGNFRNLLGMVEIKLHFEMPIAEAMTFVYQRCASVNEFSLRYSLAEDRFYGLDQSRLEELIAARRIDECGIKRMLADYSAFARDSFDRYNIARSEERDIAKELSRIMLGSNLYTRFYWKMNLADMLEFIVEETHAGPSMEVVSCLSAVLGIAEKVAPLAVKTYMGRHDLIKLIPKNNLDHRFRPILNQAVSPEAESLIDNPIQVLGQGSVTLIDYMGDDLDIVNAARVSTGRDEKSKTKKENIGLVNYLMRHRHTTPSEMVEFLWRLRIPLFIFRQGGRHRTFEKVTCDSDTNIEGIQFYHPKLEDIAAQSRSNHQGRGESVNHQIAKDFLSDVRDNESQARVLYQNLIDAGIPAEFAKRHLPGNRFITYYFKGDLHNVLHYLSLRMDSHAQLEIREVANAMAEGVKAVAPISYDAFKKYNLDSVRFSSTEIKILKAILTGQSAESVYPENWGLKNRESIEFEEKLKLLRGE